MITGERGMVGMGVMWRVDGKQWVGDVEGGSGGKASESEGGRGRHILWREREKGYKRSVRIPRASLTMINGGEWHWACSDYDTHEADSVPRFGGRRGRG
jgi:hypothetical protein